MHAAALRHQPIVQGCSGKSAGAHQEPDAAVACHCDTSIKGICDRALLLFAWSMGGRRCSEVASAQLAHLQRVDAKSFVYSLAHSKTNQRGENRPEDAKPLVGSAAKAMQAWLEVLAAAAVRPIVNERCALAGIEGPFSAHSRRAGFVTGAGRQATPMAESMALTGHQSVASVVGYFRAGASTARLLSLLDESGTK